MISFALAALRFVWLMLVWTALLALTTGIMWELGVIGAFVYVY